MKKRKKSLKPFTSMLCFLLILSMTACGVSGTEDPASAPVAEQSSETFAAQTESTPEPALEPTPAPKERYQDFYAQVNQDWISSNPLKEGEMGIGYADEATEMVTDRIGEMLRSASADDFSEEDPMRKMFAFYQQLQEEGPKREPSMKRIGELLGEIEAQGSMQQFYDNILKNETFSNFNYLMDYSYTMSSDERFRIWFWPSMLADLPMEKTKEEIQIMAQAYAGMLELFDIPADRALEMAQNALTIDSAVWMFHQNKEYYTNYYEEDDEYMKDSSFPFIPILKALGYPLMYTDEWEVYCFFVSESYIPFMQGLFAPENLQMIKDYYAVCVLDKLYPYGSSELMEAYRGMLNQLMGLPPMEDNTVSDVRVLLWNDEGAVAKWYSDRYVTQKQKEDMQEFTDVVKNEMREIVKGIDWLSSMSREKLDIKMRAIKYYMGSCDEYNLLADMEIGDTCVDTAISQMNSNINYQKRCLTGRGQKLYIRGINLYAYNAYYVMYGTAVVFTDGFFAGTELAGEEISYEEKLANLGFIIAHELAHGMDWDNINMTNSAYRHDYFDDEQWQALDKVYASVKDSVGDITTANGNVIEAGSVLTETYCDVLAMKCCMQILEKRENADYDAFFKSCARAFAEVNSPEYEAFLLRRDPHMPNHERINYVFSQYDKFYEVYDIDEDSPYFVPADKRLHIY